MEGITLRPNTEPCTCGDRTPHTLVEHDAAIADRTEQALDVEPAPRPVTVTPQPSEYEVRRDALTSAVHLHARIVTPDMSLTQFERLMRNVQDSWAAFLPLLRG
jgi:hypothetical protein